MHERQIKYSLFRNITLNFKHVCQASLLRTFVDLWEQVSGVQCQKFGILYF